MDDDADDTWREDGDGWEALALTIAPVEVPREREREPSPPPTYALAAPRVAASSSALTVRDLRAAVIGAAVALLLAAGWFARPTA